MAHREPSYPERSYADPSKAETSCSKLSGDIIRLQSSLLGFTAKFTTDPDERQDLVQDTILRALSYQDKFRDDRSLKGWLFIIMRNVFINQYRKTKRLRLLRYDDRQNAVDRIEACLSNNVDAPDIAYNDIWERVNTLRNEWLVPFKLHASGYKYHEIAKHQGIPLGTVKNRIFHARQAIKKMISH